MLEKIKITTYLKSILVGVSFQLWAHHKCPVFPRGKKCARCLLLCTYSATNYLKNASLAIPFFPTPENWLLCLQASLIFTFIVVLLEKYIFNLGWVRAGFVSSSSLYLECLTANGWWQRPHTHWLESTFWSATIISLWREAWFHSLTQPVPCWN